MNFRDKTVMFFATGGTIGYIPVAPGTFGSAAGLVLCFFLSKRGPVGAFFFTVIFILFAVFIAQKAERILQRKDPGCIVIDEIAGIVVTLIGFPFNTAVAVCGFLVFRALDILKPVPIRTVEKRLSGGVGVVMDDVVAGVIGNLILRVIQYTGTF